MSNCETGDIECRDKMDSQPEERTRHRQTYLNQGLVEQALIDHLNSTQTLQVEWEKEGKDLEVVPESNLSDMDFPVAVEVADAGKGEKS